MPRERLDKKDASDAEKIDAALFLRPKPLRRQNDGRDLFHTMPGKRRFDAVFKAQKSRSARPGSHSSRP